MLLVCGATTARTFRQLFRQHGHRTVETNGEDFLHGFKICECAVMGNVWPISSNSRRNHLPDSGCLPISRGSESRAKAFS